MSDLYNNKDDDIKTINNDACTDILPLLTDQPHLNITLEKSELTLLGTAHVSQQSAELVQQLLRSGYFDVVAIELCNSRWQAIVHPAKVARLNLFDVVRRGQVPMVAAHLALGAFQQKIADQLGIEPGAEMRRAIECADDLSLPCWLIDREVGTTLRRTYRGIPWWQRMTLLSSLLAGIMATEEVTPDEIEKLKQGDMLESSFSRFAEQSQSLYRTLITERDRYMAARLVQELNRTAAVRVLVVVGAGHLKGIGEILKQSPLPVPEPVLHELDQIPSATRRWSRLFPWIIVLILLFGFVIGFRHSSELGWDLVKDWILINGTLAAVGAILAAAHPLTVISAFIAAPLTSLNPTVGVGMVTGAVETILRKPRVGDFASLRQDSVSIRGWWSNRVTRVLLVFLFSTLGSIAGTYIAGFRIFDRLFS